MLWSLAVKFYVRHQKRSVRGSKIIAISLVALIATQILILVLTTQLTFLTSLVNEDNISLSIYPVTDSFTGDELDRIRYMIQDRPQIGNMLEEYQIFSTLETEGKMYEFDFHFVDILYFQPELEIVNSSIFPTKNLDGVFSIDRYVNINSLNYLNSNFRVVDFIPNDVNYVSTGIYIDKSVIGQELVNLIHLSVVNSKSANQFLTDLSNVMDFEYKWGDDEGQFILDAQENITNILRILTVMISILVFLGISNLMNTIIYESYYDIRILKSIGYGIISIRFVYLLLVFLLGIIGTIISVVFGILIPNVLLITLALLLEGIYTPIEINISLFITSFFVGTLVPLLATIRPIRRFVK